MKLAHHAKRERTFSFQNLRGARFRSEETAQFGLCVSREVHCVFDGLDRVSRFNRPVFCLVSLNKRREDLEPIRLGSTESRRGLKVLLDLAQSPLVVSL